MLWHISSLEQMTSLVSWGEALESVKEQSVAAVTYLMESTSGLFSMLSSITVYH